MKTKLIAVIATLLATGLVPAWGGSSIHSVAEDAAPAIQVYNGDPDETLTIAIYESGAAATNTFTIGSTVNTLDGSGGSDTVAEWVALINAYTNSAGLKVLTADGDLSLAADSTDAELLNGTYTAAPGRWVTLPWDTSVILHCDAGFRKNSRPATTTPDYVLDHIYGALNGTGLLTVSVYIDRTLVYQNTGVLPSTQYTNALQVLDLDMNIPVKSSQAMFVRATRATTATTGPLSIVATDYSP